MQNCRSVTDNIVTYEQQILDASIPESIIIIGAGGMLLAAGGLSSFLCRVRE